MEQLHKNDIDNLDRILEICIKHGKADNDNLPDLAGCNNENDKMREYNNSKMGKAMNRIMKNFNEKHGQDRG